MHIDPDSLDAGRFETLAAHGHRLLAQAHPAVAKEQLTEALALWRGPALAEFAFEQFAQAEAARLEQVRAVVHEDLLEAELALGNHVSIIGDITVAVGEHPLRERLWSLLMLALYRSGRQGEALRAYAMARHTLAEELGIDPSPALRSLEAAILAQSPELEYYRPESWTGDLPTLNRDDGHVVAQTPKIAPMVGREGQLQSLLTAVSRAELGQGGVVLISGDAGIGKTRLAVEVAAEAERRNWPVAWGSTYQRDGAPLLWPWIQIVGDLLARSDPDRIRRALAGRTSVLRPLLPPTDAFTGDAADPPAPHSDSQSAQFTLFEAMTGFLIDLADAGLIVVIVEDLQWADQLSLRLLEHVAGRLQTGHILLVATSRPPENLRQVALCETLGILARLPTFDWIELNGLNRHEVGRLLIQSGARANVAQVGEIHSCTDGNPFFVSNFARFLASREDTHIYPDGFIPNAVLAVIRHRLSGLQEQTRTILAAAAAMGREFDIGTVAAAVGANLDNAVAWMRPAVFAGLVTEDRANPGRYRFCQDLVRGTLKLEIDGLHRSALNAFGQRAAGETAPDEVVESDVDGSDGQQKAYG